MKNVLAIRGTPGHWKADEFAPYRAALYGVGIRPILASPTDSISLEQCSGLVLMGGPDVNPTCYGQERLPPTQRPDDRRDATELAAIKQSLARDLPILAICRGLQILNVSHGGTLIQHLNSPARHRQRPADLAESAHSIEITPGTKLAQIAGGTLKWSVNSRHHQAVACLGEKLQITARDSQDGTVEAVERPDKRFVVAVQWHPENHWSRDARQKRLFEAFRDALK